jgi:hypothetical protein
VTVLRHDGEPCEHDGYCVRGKGHAGQHAMHRPACDLCGDLGEVIMVRGAATERMVCPRRCEAAAQNVWAATRAYDQKKG